MSFTLTMPFNDCFEYKEKVLHVDMAFDNILLLFELFEDKNIEKWEKIFIALQLLIDDIKEVEIESFEEACELYKYVLKEFLDIDLDEKDADGDTTIKTFDFKKDADLIYASFFAVYKLDLFELRGELHWKKFRALFLHLDDNSPIKQVINYRIMKVPSEKEASKEYIQHVRKMKQRYSLEEGPQDATTIFDSLASTFKPQEKGVK